MIANNEGQYIRRSRYRISCSVVLATAFAAAGMHAEFGSRDGVNRVHSTKGGSTYAVEVGLASWYGIPYHGRQAASGQTYDMNKLTAAHRELPFGTWVRVQNLANARSVDVEINDRGPFVSGRMIDVSRAAARILAMEEAGLTLVRLQVLGPHGR